MLPRVWTRTILRLDVEVFYDSRLDRTDASVWIRPALKSTNRKIIYVFHDEFVEMNSLIFIKIMRLDPNSNADHDCLNFRRECTQRTYFARIHRDNLGRKLTNINLSTTIFQISRIVPTCASQSVLRVPGSCLQPQLGERKFSL